MKYLLTFNESVFDGDFLYKEIEAHEFRNLEDDKEGVVPNEDTLDKIYDLFKGKVDDDIDKSLIDANSGFYNFTGNTTFLLTILHEDGEDNIYITPKEDDWYLVEFVIWGSNIRTYPKIFICDQWEGLVNFIENEF